MLIENEKFPFGACDAFKQQQTAGLNSPAMGAEAKRNFEAEMVAARFYWQLLKLKDNG